MPMDVRVGDIIKTRKKHPCGGEEWTVIRTGADVKIRCHTCGRIVMLERADYEKRVKKLLQAGEAPQTSTEGL